MDDATYSLVTTIVANVLLFLLLFGMTATVEISHMKDQVRNLKAMSIGMCCQFILLPFLGFLIVTTLQLEYPVGITIIVCTSSPGGSYSNWWCSLFNAELALSIAMTSLSSLMSIFMLPANIWLYTTLVYDADVVNNISLKSLFGALAVVISAVILGLLFSYHFKSREFHERINAVSMLRAILMVVWSSLLISLPLQSMLHGWPGCHTSGGGIDSSVCFCQPGMGQQLSGLGDRLESVCRGHVSCHSWPGGRQSDCRRF
jgi:predicted Na+-dependent transporter